MEKNNPFYQIIRELEFDKKIQSLAKSYKRLDDIDHCIDLALQRCPQRFNKIDDTHYWWKLDYVGDGFPQLVIVYQFLEAEGKVLLVDTLEVTPA